MPERLTERERNALLRRVDWRFLLREANRPAALEWGSGALSEATRLVANVADTPASAVDLVVLTNPTPRRLAAAREALLPGGEVYCEWRLPRPGGVQRARRSLQKAGFTDIRILWPWPPPSLQAPQLWLPVGAPRAVKRFVELRPAPTSRWQRVGRSALPALVVCGVTAPVCALARRPAHAATGSRPGDPLEELIALHRPASRSPATDPSWVLLTGGHRAISKVVAVPFFGPRSSPPLVVKFARVPEADAGLRREAEVLRILAARGSVIPGLPEVLATARRCGRAAVAETAVLGVPLLSRLTRDTFPQLAAQVVTLLARLAQVTGSHPREDWNIRLVTGPFETFRRMFGSALDVAAFEAARASLATLRPLALSCEHRDCSPWNIALTADGEPALLDWESAEPEGVPALDLIYFLTTAAFVLEGALETGRTRETYARLLDPTSAIGRVAATCLQRYTTLLGIEPAQLAPLRLLCWIVHARSDHAHAAADAGGVPSAHALRQGTFVGLLQQELSSRSS